jgi:DNA-binding MarR family transcriptional regulator
MATKELVADEAPKVALHYPPTAGMLLVKLGRTAERRYTEALKPAGLTPKHLGVLFELRSRPTTQQSLCESTGLDASKVVGLLNDLEDEGLLVRRRDPADRRRHIVEVSKEGRAQLAIAERAAKAVEEELFADLDERERHELRILLARVAESSGVLEGCVGLVMQSA